MNALQHVSPPTTSGTPSTYPGPTGESTLADSKSVDLSGKTIYSIDASGVGATDDPGVADSDRTDGGDGLYVFDGNDTDGWTAYKVDGNAQQGWNVVAKVDDAFALSIAKLILARLVRVTLQATLQMTGQNPQEQLLVKAQVQTCQAFLPWLWERIRRLTPSK